MLSDGHDELKKKAFKYTYIDISKHLQPNLCALYKFLYYYYLIYLVECWVNTARCNAEKEKETGFQENETWTILFSLLIPKRPTK